MDHRRLTLNEKFDIKIDAKPDEEIKIETKGDDADELMDFVHSILGDNIDFFDQDFPGEEDDDVPAEYFGAESVKEAFGNNAVKGCKVNKVVAHCKEEKPVCKVEKPVLPDELTDPDEEDLTDIEFAEALKSALEEKNKQGNDLPLEEADWLDRLKRKGKSTAAERSVATDMNKSARKSKAWNIDNIFNGYDVFDITKGISSTDTKASKQFGSFYDAETYAKTASQQNRTLAIYPQKDDTLKDTFRDLKWRGSKDLKNVKLMTYKNGKPVQSSSTTPADSVVQEIVNSAKAQAKLNVFNDRIDGDVTSDEGRPDIDSDASKVQTATDATKSDASTVSKDRQSGTTSKKWCTLEVTQKESAKNPGRTTIDSNQFKNDIIERIEATSELCEEKIKTLEKDEDKKDTKKKSWEDKKKALEALKTAITSHSSAAYMLYQVLSLESDKSDHSSLTESKGEPRFATDFLQDTVDQVNEDGYTYVLDKARADAVVDYIYPDKAGESSWAYRDTEGKPRTPKIKGKLKDIKSKEDVKKYVASEKVTDDFIAKHPRFKHAKPWKGGYCIYSISEDEKLHKRS